MKLRQLNIIGSIFLLATALMFCGCQVEPGDAGPDGTAGLNGTNGTNGTAYDEAVQYGGVTVYFSGKRPDGVSFSDSIHFKYAPTDLDYSYAYVSDNDYADFEFKRYSGPDFGDGSYYGYIQMWYEIYTGEGGPDRYFEISIEDNIASQDFKYFRVDNYAYSTEGSNVDAEFSGESYDESTGSLKFNFSFVVPADYNETGFDLNVDAVVDIKVFQYVYYDEGGGRLNTNHIAKDANNIHKIKLNLHH